MASDDPITAENAYERSLKNSLFEGLTEEQIKTLFSISKEITLEKDCYLMREGDPAQEIFLIIDGVLEISRYNAKHKQNHAIATLKAGDTVGEVSLLDSGLRSASACARSQCHLRSISFDDLQAIANQDKAIYSIFYHLTKNIGQRLRHSNDVALQAMERQLDEFKTRVTLGNFFVYIVIMLSLFTFSLDGLKYVMNVGKNSSFITLPLTLAFFIFFVIFMKTSSFPLSTFGLTLKNGKRAIFEGIVFTIPFGVIILGLKWILISYVSGYMGKPLIEGIAVMNADPKTWWTFLFIYILIVAPLQEFLSRGGLQGPLEEFLSSKYKVPLAILVSNLLFSTMHLFMSLEIALLVFIPGVYFGWLYSRTHNLLGVWIAHALVGTIGLSIVGF
ncbi:MAG: cyclic nucleotide-binding domain-containing protein [Deltaproteobacteria bacterium]